MNTDDNPRCVFTTELSHDDLGHVITIPAEEIQFGSVDPESPVRVAIYQSSETPDSHSQSQPDVRETDDTSPQPPVSVGDTRKVTVDDRGDQGDGIARVDSGFVLIIPEATVGDNMLVEVTNVEDTFAIAQPVEQSSGTEQQMPSYQNG